MPHVAQLNLVALGLLIAGSGIMQIRKPRDKRSEGLMLVSIFTFMAMPIIDWILTQLVWIAPIRFDQYVFCFDGVFGQPSFYIGRLFAHYAWFQTICLDAYSLLPCSFLAVATGYFLLQPLEDAIWLTRTIALSCFLAPLLYIILPVTGPRYAFSTFPDTFPLHLVPRPVFLSTFPNGVPSVHVSIALLVLYFARRWKLGTVLGSIYLALTVFSTLGTGEHYLFDLFASVPYCMLVIYVGDRRQVICPNAELHVLEEDLETADN